MKRLWWGVWLWLSVSFCLPVSAVDYFLITDLGTSAESISRGNIEGFSRSATSVFENPASLRYVKTMSFSVFHTTLLDEYTYSNLAFCGATPLGNLGLGYMQSGVQDIPYTGVDESGEFVSLSHFNYSNRVLKLAYQFCLFDAIYLGAAYLVYDMDMLTISGRGSNAELGGAMDFDNLSVSFTARNVLTQMTSMYQLLSNSNTSGALGNNALVQYSDTEDAAYKGIESLPLQLILSGQYKLGDLAVQGQLKALPSRQLLLKSSAAVYRPGFADFVQVSAGFKEYPLMNTSKANITMGMALQLDRVEINYAYEMSDYVESTPNHYFSLNFNF